MCVHFCVTHIIFNAGITLEHSTAILSNARQVIAEFPIMFNLKSHCLVWLYIQPYRELCKGIFWQAFKPRLQNMRWRKWFKILRKQSFILERLFTWDNKLLPRIGSIHQENTMSQHTLAGACLSAATRPWLWSIIHGASKVDKRLATLPWWRPSCQGWQTLPYPGEAPQAQMTPWTLETYLIFPMDPHGIHELLHWKIILQTKQTRDRKSVV